MKIMQGKTKGSSDGRFVLGLAEKEEIIELQKLRYEELILNFDASKNGEGLDVSEYDAFCDHLIVKELETGKIVGTYRLMTNKHLVYKDKFICEDEFDISKLKKSGYNLLELGRAVVHKDYRQGTVLKLLWNGIVDYAKENDVRYLFGTASFHGTDPSIYEHALSKLYYEHLVAEEIACTAKTPCAPLAPLQKEEIDPSQAKKELPSLIRGYLSLGCKVGDGVFLDHDFNSTDVMIVLDVQKINFSYFNRVFSV